MLHFWQGMPTHLVSILPHKVVVDLVSMCDIMLYKVINNVLISSPLQNFPERWWKCRYVYYQCVQEQAGKREGYMWDYRGAC